ncbi:neutral and basic amino acid transport protein rBAT-like [Anneissia japonica]|uniref:neutral and basic amino acid transport protein rBAT-like n=1 Tax=Anneissia japonica TaxID=1529436 RepID=UPI0014258995|nr:neutral and basic amino acid transport protein rBAT-like [Anneissia japonica]
MVGKSKDKKQVSEWDSTNEFEFDVMASSLVYKPKQTQSTVFATSSSAEFAVPTIHERTNTQATRRRRIHNDDPGSTRAMGKNELLILSSKPMWAYPRRAALVMLFLTYIILFAVAVSMLVNTPPCPTNNNWYELGIGYQILPRSFRDSNGDGIGDINGIKEKLSYLKDIGVSIIWLGSVSQTPYQDLGYDVSNFIEIDPMIGTSEDFKNLVDEIHKQGAFYMLSSDVLHYWLSQNVDGFFLRHVNSIFESNELNRDEPVNPIYYTYDNETQILKSYEELSHIYTRDQQEVYQLLKTWRSVMQEYETMAGDGESVRKLLVVDVNGSNLTETLKYSTEGMADYAFNYALYGSLSGTVLASKIEEWLRVKPEGSITSWSIGSADNHRIMSRYNYISKAMMTLLLTLPGSAVLYYGDEIGMTDIPVTHTISRDPKIFEINETYDNLINNISRDAARSPMQWSSNINAGFSDANSENLWLPINSNYIDVNAEVRNLTYLKCLRDLVSLRGKRTFKTDQLRILRAQKDVLTYARELIGYPTYFVAINLADFKILDRYYLHNTDLYGVSEIGTVVFNTNGEIGNSVDIRNLTLEADQALIVEFTK